MNSLTAILSLSCVVFLSAFSLQEKKKVIFFGDSITQAGVQPGGYITQIGELASKENKSGEFDLIGSGIGGNKIYDLYLRLDEDVLSRKPDVVVIYVGVNDVWHKRLSGTGTDADKFEKFYAALVAKLLASNSKVMLCTPAVIGEKTDMSNELDGDLNQYSNIIRKLAAKNKLPLVDLRRIFQEYDSQHNPNNNESGILTTDRVHLNDMGNRVVAEAVWKALKTI